MFAAMLSAFRLRAQWVRAMRLYRAEEYERFLAAVDSLATRKSLSPYQLALKANALLLVGRYKEALALFSLLTEESGESKNRRYIALFARAMISDINGDSDGFARNAAAASGVRSKLIVRRNLPL